MDYNDDEYFPFDNGFYLLSKSQYDLGVDLQKSNPDGLTLEEKNEESGFTVKLDKVEGMTLVFQSHHFGWDEERSAYTVFFRLMYYAAEENARRLAGKLSANISTKNTKGFDKPIYVLDGKQALK